MQITFIKVYIDILLEPFLSMQRKGGGKGGVFTHLILYTNKCECKNNKYTKYEALRYISIHKDKVLLISRIQERYAIEVF